MKSQVASIPYCQSCVCLLVCEHKFSRRNYLTFMKLWGVYWHYGVVVRNVKFSPYPASYKI